MIRVSLKGAAQWRKVARGSLPAAGQRVLICGGDCWRVAIGHMEREPLPEETGFYFHEEGEQVGDEGCNTAIYPTYWMPLPEPHPEAKYEPVERVSIFEDENHPIFGQFIGKGIKW